MGGRGRRLAETFWRFEPENAKAHNNLAAALLQRGALDESHCPFP